MFINNHKKQIRLLCRVLFALYIAGLVYFLFFADMLDRVGIERSYHYNVIPFREIRRFIVYADLLGPVAVISNLFGNIAIFMPFGFLLPHIDLDGLDDITCPLLFSLLLTILIETTQMMLNLGQADLTDIVANVLGGVLGYVVYWLLGRWGVRKRT